MEASQTELGDYPLPLDTTQTCRFTSGSRGSPGCLEFSGVAIEMAARHWAEGSGLTIEDRVLCLAGFSNGLAFNTSLLATFISGGELHLRQGLPMVSHVADIISSRNITRLVGFPVFYRMLVQNENIDHAKLSSLSCAISAAARLPEETRDQFYDQFGLRVSDYYGIAETGPVTFEVDKNINRGMGKALPGSQIRISPINATTNEIQVRTSSMASRYLNRPGELESCARQ